jgi:hypothetical protein
MPGNSFPYSLAQTLLWKVRNFPDEAYNFNPEDNLTTLMGILLGPAGTGQMDLVQTSTRINQQHIEFSDLDTILGVLMDIPRLSSEIYSSNINPFRDQLDLTDWKDVWAKDANYRERLVGTINALLRGATTLGVQALVEATIQNKARVVENWTAASGTMSDLGYSRNLDGNEIIIIPNAPSNLTPTVNDRASLINSSKKLIPTGAVVTVISGAVDNFINIPFTSVSGSSEFFFYNRDVSATNVNPPSNVKNSPDYSVSSRYWLQNNKNVNAPFFAHLQSQESVINLTNNISTVQTSSLNSQGESVLTTNTRLPIGYAKTRITSTVYGAQ